MKFGLNTAFTSASGQIDGWVYRTARGRVIVSRRPDMSNVVSSESQIAHRERFKMAAAYGKSMMNSEDMRDMYMEAARKKDLPIFSVMIADYFHAPEIKDIDLEGYHGIAGNVIDTIVIDDFAVQSVHVKIIDDQGTVIESGNAKTALDRINRWYYNATVTITSDITIEVIAKDYPGNITVRQFPFTKPN